MSQRSIFGLINMKISNKALGNAIEVFSGNCKESEDMYEE